MPSSEDGAGCAPMAPRGNSESVQRLPTEQRECLEYVDKLLALLQFALTGRDVTELNSDVQAGCDLILEQVRVTLKGVATRQ